MPEVALPVPYDFLCAHCGERMAGDMLPTRCPHCGDLHSHEIGAAEPSRMWRKQEWLRCRQHGCWYYVKANNLPALYRQGSRKAWRKLPAPNKKSHWSGKKEGILQPRRRRKDAREGDTSGRATGLGVHGT